jgi:hypothetical protein
MFLEIWFNLMDLVAARPQFPKAVVRLATGETEYLNSVTHAR